MIAIQAWEAGFIGFFAALAAGVVVGLVIVMIGYWGNR